MVAEIQSQNEYSCYGSKPIAPEVKPSSKKYKSFVLEDRQFAAAI